MDFSYLGTIKSGLDREQALHDLIIAYRNEVWDYAFSLTRRRDMTDDIVQDVFLKVYENLHSFRGEASVKTWLLSITRNVSLNWKKSSFIRRVLLMSEVSRRSQGSSAENEALDGLLLSETWRVVLGLPAKHREIIILHAYHQLSQSEIAALLCIPVGTVKSRLFHARKIAAAKLAKEVLLDELSISLGE